MADKRLILTPRPPLEDSSEVAFRVFDNGDGSYSLGVRSSQATGASTALATPPAALTAGADTVLTFAPAAQHLLIQNKSTTAVYIEFGAVATVGSFLVDAGQTFSIDIPVTALHVYSAAALNVNGTADANLVVKGWT